MKKMSALVSVCILRQVSVDVSVDLQGHVTQELSKILQLYEIVAQM